MISQLQPPALRYNGVTLELEFPGRFDIKKLCDGSSHYVITEALGYAKGGTRYNIELRTRAITTPYRPGTKVVLLCGEKALGKLGYPGERLNTLRGSPFLVEDVVYIPTYHPQQCADRGNYEKAFNPYAHDSDEGVEGVEDRGDDSDVKDMGKTARRNFRFWFIQDVCKAVRIAREGYKPNHARYHTNLTPDGVIEKLRLTTSSTPLYLDIETDIRTGRMICFAWSNNPHEIYVAPILRTGLQELAFAEPTLRLVLRELALAISRASVVVCHNALFDLFILAWRYHIPPPRQSRCFDTMVAHARIHVDIEKSLGHCVSLYTEQPYHKDQGNFSASNYTQWQQLLTYNAKDVETTALVHQAQVALAQQDSGLHDSIAQGNALVRPLLLKSLRGVYIDKDKLCGRIDELRKRAKWIEENILCKLAKHPLNPRSPKQVDELLYTEFGLPRSSDPTISATGKDALYRLALKFPLPILSTILHVRQTSKEAGQLSAKLWRDSHITCAYIITGTKTFRLSSRKLLDVWGTNMQNWSKRTRAIVRAREGYVLVQVDQSGAEALIVAYIAPPGRYRDLFIHKVSPHVYFGIFAFPQVWRAELGYGVEYLYEKSIAEVKADPKWPEIARCIKASDNNPPARRYYYFQKQINHCVKAGYEVLTPDGWMAIETNPAVIACYDADNTLTTFESVITWNNQTYQGELIKFSGKEFEQDVTPNHKVPYWSNGKMKIADADSYYYKYTGSSIGVVTKLDVKSDCVDNNILALALALQADGHIHKDCNRWTFRFGKEEKINRLRNILIELKALYTAKNDSDGYYKFSVIPVDGVYKYLSKDKEFILKEFLALSTYTREFVCAEVFKWDGCDLNYMSGYQTVYRTTSKHNAEVVHTTLRMTGCGSTLTKLEDYYTVTRNARFFSRTVSANRYQYNGTVHCPTTPTGYFIIRSPSGKISITGNSSNYDIKAQRFASNLLEKSEGQVSLPVSECDRLLTLYHKLYPEIRGGFQSYVRNQLFKHKELRNLFGYPRRFYGWVEGDANILKDAYSWIPQSTVGCITGLADSSLQARIDDGILRDLSVWQNNHDSLLVECPIGTERDVAKVVCDAMNQKMVNHRGEEFAMRSEASVGEDWYAMSTLDI